MKKHLDDCLSKLEEEQCEGMEPWQVTLPIANLGMNIHFSVEELSVLLSLKDDDLFNELVPLDDMHNSIKELFQTYHTKRIEILNLLPAPEMKGLVGESILSEEQAKALAPKSAELNHLVMNTQKQCTQTADVAKKTLEKLTGVLNKKLSLAVSVKTIA